jgi:translation initiation factor 1 (eIF-1/SUI1)
MASSRNRGVSLTWQGGLSSSSPSSDSVSVLHPKEAKSQKAEPQKIVGSACVRFEKKGRGGSPVLVLFRFSSPHAKCKESLKLLCSQLKTKFACGGAVENDEIILMLRDEQKLKTVLKSVFEIDLKGQ